MLRLLGTQQKITAPFHLIRGQNAQFLFIRRIFPEDLFLTGFLTVHLNSIPGKHRIIESTDPVKKTVKYLLTSELTREASKILTVYGHRWVIEEFFRNAKQLSDMEGATVRSRKGVTLSLCLVFRIDFLVHYENCKQSTSGELPKDSLTVPSIIRRAQYENLEVFADRVQCDEEFAVRWFEVEKRGVVHCE